MNKADKILVCLVLFIGVAFFFLRSTAKSSYAEVYFKKEKILTINLYTDRKTYTVDGTLGKIILEVEHGKIRVLEEESPKHICSRQGWVSKVGDTIICLPNEITVTLKGKKELDTIVR